MKKFLNDENGQGMVEYVLIIVLVAAAVVAVIKLFGQQIVDLLTGAKNKIAEETE